MMQLYVADSRSRNGQRAAIAVIECRAACEFRKLDLGRGDHKQAEYLAINPLGKIPVLIDPDGPGGQPLVLRQSWAILLYLAEKTDRFLPADPGTRARMWQWVAEAMSDLAPTSATAAILNNAIYYVPKFTTVPEQASRYYEEALTALFRAADNHLARSAYFAGDAVTVADLGIYPSIDGRRKMIRDLELSHLSDWAERIGQRPAVQEATRKLDT